MATLYFTSTAATGDGTLRNTILSALSGDVVMPDPDVFPAGTTIVVSVTGLLRPTSSVTLDSGKTNLIIQRDSGQLLDCRSTYGCNSFTANGVTFIGRIICVGESETTQSSVFNACTLGSNETSSALCQSTAHASLTFNDCLLVGSLSYAIYVSGTNVYTTLNRSTLAANLGDAIYGNASNNVTVIDCIVAPDLTTAGFCNVPQDVSDYSTSNLPPWQSWNFALTPSSIYASGAVSATDAYDRIGVKRGRSEVSGTEYALGAYEVVNADYYQTDSAVSFDTPSGWSTVRGGSSTPESLQSGVYFLDRSSSFALGVPSAGSSLIIADHAHVAFSSAVDIASATLYSGTTLVCSGSIGNLVVYPEASCEINSIIVDALVLYNAVSFTLSSNVHLTSLTMMNGSVLNITGDDVIVGTETFTYSGAVSVIASGSAFFGVPVGVSVSGVTLQDVTVCHYGAGVTSVSGVYLNDRVVVSIGKTNSSIPVLLQYKGANDSEWTTAELELNGPSATLNIGSDSVIRVCDGRSFTTTTINVVTTYNETAEDVVIGYVKIPETPVGYLLDSTAMGYLQ